MRVALQYIEFLKRLAIFHLWQWVGIDIAYISKMVDQYHQLAIDWEYVQGWEESWQVE